MQFNHLLHTSDNGLSAKCGKRKPLKTLVHFFCGCHHIKKCPVRVKFHAMKASAKSRKELTIVIICYLAGEVALIPKKLDRISICRWMTEQLGGEHSIARLQKAI